jgi:serine protease Do
MKYAALLAAALLFAAAALSADAEKPELEKQLVEAVKKARPSAVKIILQKYPQNAFPQDVTVCSGLVIDNAGTIATISRDISENSAIYVELAGGKIIPAKLAGVDEWTGIAALTVNASETVPCEFANAAELEAGLFIAAIGAPLGLAGSVVYGNVAAVNRALLSENGAKYIRMIQVTMEVRTGECGAPVFDSKGRAIGLLSPVWMESRESAPRRNSPANAPDRKERVYFAMPINQVRASAAEILKSGGVNRGVMGLLIVDFPPGAELAGKAVRVEAVIANSPAAKAGIGKGDAVLSIAGREVHSGLDVEEVMQTVYAGAECKIEIQRGTERIVVTLTPAPKPIVRFVPPGK